MSQRRYFIGFVLILVLCSCALFFINYGSAFALQLDPKIQEKSLLFLKSANITILYWNKFFGKNDFYLGTGPISSHCPLYNNCYATRDRNREHMEKVDAIIFHGIDHELNRSDLPTKRHSKQSYVFMALESPTNRYVHHEFDDYFNLTMTYQLDSDVIWSYADVVDKNDDSVVFVPSRTSVKWRENTVSREKQEEEEKINSIIEGKRKLAIWYRSNCETRSGRENYVSELDKHLSVAKYGGCSTDAGCPKEKDCFKTDVEPNYFFYLSFENSLCDDYVTEKFFHALKYYVVPVVYGGANYSQFAPPNSYINALDFKDPKDLAKYLSELAGNVKEYKKYFDWKKEYRINSPIKRVICDLCEMLNSNYSNSYKISKWYSEKRCSIQNQLDKQISEGGVHYSNKATLANH